ncbi:MAG: hypothetical protein IPO66_18855 [Rhodanobacteraceae bacterium]|nr:hypothetical protein [Rhodanobacteraceae bacterium]
MRLPVWMSVLLLLCASSSLFAQDRAYTEGTVSVVTSVKIMDGQGEAYMNYLAKTYKPLMEAQKKAGNVLDYSVYRTQARTPNDPDMYLVVTYANMAAFDGLADRTEPVMKEVTGLNREQAAAAGVERGKMREILGSEMIRKLDLK